MTSIVGVWPLFAVAGLAGAVASCSFEARSDADGIGVRNTCERDSDCGDGACRSGACVALSATVDAVLIEVSMPALGAGDATGARYWAKRRFADVTADGGLQLNLDSVALISGLVVPQPREDSDCTYRFQSSSGEIVEVGLDASIPVLATLMPTERLLGVAPLSYSAKSVPRESNGSISHRFEVRVAPGTYDVYLVPEIRAADGCPVAPQLLLNQVIGAGALELSLPLPPARVLNLVVSVPKGDGEGAWLRGWRVDMIDPESGHVLSTMESLDNPDDEGDSIVYHADLHYSPVWDTDARAYHGEGDELVRFRPPSDQLAPTVYLERASLEIFTEGEGVVDQLSDVFTTVSVEGEVESLSLQIPVAAQLAFIATRIDALEPGILGSYIVNSVSDDDGRFSVDLLPGRYKVRAVPGTGGCCDGAASRCACASAVEVEWEVSGTPSVQAGRTIQLPDAAVLSGRIVSPGGSMGLAGATVELVPAPTALSQMDEILRDGAFTPRVASVATSDSGVFTMAADPGLFRMWVRPSEGSGFSWRLTPNVTVENDGSSTDLGRLRMPLPIRYHGQVTLPAARDLEDVASGAGAMVRAYAYLDGQLRLVNDPAMAESAIPISEARADEDGGFILLIPDFLHEP